MSSVEVHRVSTSPVGQHPAADAPLAAPAVGVSTVRLRRRPADGARRRGRSSR